MTLRKSILWTLFWVGAALMVNIVIYFYMGSEKAMQFLAGYVIEKSLSVDNLFVFLIIFTFFKLSVVQQRHILNYGIIGVIILRGIMIYTGIALIEHFEWILYLFGAFLVYSGFKLIYSNDIEVNPENKIMMRLLHRIFPIKEDHGGTKFFIKEDNKWFITSMFIVLVVIETTDVVFAVDSIPAVFGITTDPFIVFSSNLFAVLGLRSIYFVLERVQSLFVYVKYGVGLVLVFVGMKMLAAHVFEVGTMFSLFVVLGILSLSVILSAIKNFQQLVKSKINEIS